MAPKLKEYKSRKALTNIQLKRKDLIQDWFDKTDVSLVSVLYTAVAKNTVRAFHDMPQRPSWVVREWIFWFFSSKERISELRAIRSQTVYDAWHEHFCWSFARHWKRAMGKPMVFGPSRKLPDLVMKQFVRWSGLRKSERRRLTQYLHVPLDSYSLAGIRNCVTENRPRKGASMGSIKNGVTYASIQQAIAAITHTVKLPPIYYDVLIWNVPHKSRT